MNCVLESMAFKASYWHTPDPQPLEWLTIPQLIDQWAEKKPDDEAYVVRMNGAPREAVTFKQLQQKTEALAAGLLKLGLRPGDFVLITGITCMNWILTDLACASIGIVTIRGQLSSLDKEGLLYLANKNNIKAIFFHPGVDGTIAAHLKKCIPDAFSSAKELFSCSSIPSLKHLTSLSTMCFDVKPISDIVTTSAETLRIKSHKARVNPEDVVTVFMTSGSTGFPKGIPYTHFTLYNMYNRAGKPEQDIGEEDIVFNDRCLSWTGSIFHLPLSKGCKLVYVHPLAVASEQDIDFSIQVIHEEKVSCGNLMQYLMLDVIERMRSGKAKAFKWKLTRTGGALIQDTILQSLLEYSSCIKVVYGATECNPIATCMVTKDTTSYAGYISKGVEVKIIDESGCVIPMGETGEIVVRSPLAFHGYLHNESGGMTRDTDGWIKTDDMGNLTNGFLQVFGRRSHVISVGTRKIYPITVENMILKFPGVAKVAVIGVPDKRLGENLCACIIPTESATLTSDDMLCCFDDMYKTDEGLGITPAYFIFMDNFPTVNSKVDKNTIQKMATQKLGL